MPDVQMNCTFCHKPFRVASDHVGQEVCCPHCRTIVTVPGRAAPAQTPAREIAQSLRGGAAGKAPVPPAPAPQDAARAAGTPAGEDWAATVSRASGGTAGGERHAGKGNLATRMRKEAVVRPGGVGKTGAVVWIVILVVLLVAAAVVGSIAFKNLGGSQTSIVPAGSVSTPAPDLRKTGPDSRAVVASRSQNRGFVPGPRTTPSTGAKPESDDEGPAAPAATSTAKGGAGKAAPIAAAPLAPLAGTNPAGIQVTDLKVFSGFKGGSATYVGCRLKNDTGQDIPALRLTTVGSEGGKDIGTAVAIIYNIPAGATIPVVAEWGPHDEGARASMWSAPVTEANPPGLPRDLPKLVASTAWALRDPNESTLTGRVKTTVINQGMMTVPAPEASAILVGEDGTIVGVAKAVVPKELKPGEAAEVMLPWERTVGSKVKSAEIWVQPAR